MKNLSTMLGMSLFALTLSGCATTSLTDAQKADLAPYQEKLTTACAKYKEFKGESAANCQSNAEHSTEVMQKYYLLYNEDKLVEACKNVATEGYTACLKNIQNEYYSDTTDNLLTKYKF